MKIFLNWLFFLFIIAAIYLSIRFCHLIPWPKFPTMTGLQVIFFALSLAFTWVEILKWGVTKPFNCFKCMTGWFALILAFMFHVEFWPFALPAGLFVGSVFEGIKMRWL